MKAWKFVFFKQGSCRKGTLTNSSSETLVSGDTAVFKWNLLPPSSE